MTQQPMPGPGWYPDPTSPWLLRWWDGSAWTSHVQQPSVPPTPAPPQWVSPGYGPPGYGGPWPGSPTPWVSAPPAGPRPVDRIVRFCGAAALVGGVLSLIGGFLPWQSMSIPPTFNRSRDAWQLGTNFTFSADSGCILICILAIIALGAAAAITTRPRWSRLSLIPIGLLVVEMATIHSQRTAAEQAVLHALGAKITNWGPGYWLSWAGAMIALAAWVIPLVMRRTTAGAPAV